MADSEVSIVNRALQKLGSKAIISLDDAGVPNAARAKLAYPIRRDALLRKYAWNFAKRRVQLAADVTAPVFGYDNAFPLPSDFIRLVPVVNDDTDWVIEGRSILTNDSAPLNVRYIARVTDTTQFDEGFSEALAANLAYELCEVVTQSNTKKAMALQDYKDAIAEARRNNAFENYPEDQPDDPWVTARL